jgi:hypothetical protein
MIVQQRCIPYSKKHEFLQMFANPNTICLTIMRNTILKFAKHEKNQTAGVTNKKNLAEVSVATIDSWTITDNNAVKCNTSFLCNLQCAVDTEIENEKKTK